MSFKLLSFIVFFFLSNYTIAQSKVDFLKKNAVPISVDVNNNDFSDLQELKKYIGNTRLVLLGEESHGDGTTFETKTRIIKFLHEQMGFNILAFESNFYNAEVAWQEAVKAKNPMNSFQESVFWLWSHSNETQNLFQYLASNIHEEKPLKLTGFDCQYNGKFIKESTKDLVDFFEDNKVEFKDQYEKDNFYGVYNRIIFKTRDSLSKFDWPLFKKSLESIISQLTKLDTIKNKIWLQHFISSENYIKGLLEQVEAIDINNLRDSVMAQNILWLMNKGYPEEKIIIWAHNYHISKSKVKEKVKTMGQYLTDSLGSDKIYSVGFIAFAGEYGWYNGKYLNKIRHPIKNSYENLFRKTKVKNLFFDLKHLSQQEEGQWLNEKRNLRYEYYSPSINSWPKVFDALIYNKEMKRSTAIN